MSLTIKLHINPYNTCNFHTSTKTKFTSYNTARIKPNLIYLTNPLLHFVHNSKHIMQNSSFPSIKSSLIDPDGGSLVDLVVPESGRELKAIEAASMTKVKLTKIDVEWVHVVSEGWATPLKGFIRENEYLQSLHFNSLKMEDRSVVNMSLSIVLAIDDETKERIGSEKNVALVAPDGELIGSLRRLIT